MKKFYSMLLLMVLMVSSAFAQEPIESKAQLSNSKAYTISSSRCFLQVIENGTCLYTSTGSASGVVTEQDATSKNQQFALINGGKNFFLYSVGAGKFIDKNGNFTDSVSADVAINVVEISSTSSAYPINLNWDDSHYLNTQESGNFATGYLIDSWTDLDQGNEFAIIEAADFTDDAAIKKAQAFDNNILVDSVTYVYTYNGETVYTYTNIVKGESPLTVTYDAPGARVGASCSDPTPDSKEITESTKETVTYTYNIDYSALPFVPTTIENGKFAAGTKWYYVSPADTNTFCYTSKDNDGLYCVDNGGIHVTDGLYLFTFVGDPFVGFEIYNYTKGATKPLYGVENSSAYYSDVAFTDGKSCKYYLEAGTSDGQYRFNKASHSECYLNAYNGVVDLFTWSESATYNGSQYYISVATDDEIEKALTGVLTFDPSYANNYVFRNGAAIEKLQILFEGSDADAAIAVVEGMETGKLTLQDADGNIVATPTYSVNAEDPTILDVVFDPAFNTEGDYVLVMQRGTVKGATSGMPNNEFRLNYSFQSTAEQIVTARIWKTMSAYDSYGYSNWSTLPYTTHDDGEYYTCKVKVLGKDAFMLMDWTGDGSGDSIKVQFNPNKTYSNVLYCNDLDLDPDYGSCWLSTNITLDKYGYGGTYLYPDYSDATYDGSYGMCALSCFDYYDYYTLGGDGYSTYIMADFYMDDRYKYEEIVDAKVCNKAFTELDYDDDYYPSFGNVLPFDATTGTYDIQVGIENDSTITLINYTGVEGDDLTIVFNPEDGSVSNFNGLATDNYGSSWISSPAFTNYYGGWYGYTGNYCNVKYDSATKSGYAVISAYDYTTDMTNGAYHYLYVAIGNYVPTAIKSVKASTENTAAKSTIYNLAGQKLSAPHKGVNIINGKKVMY